MFSAFNNFISNIGYVLLGLLFLGLTARRLVVGVDFSVICQLYIRVLVTLKNGLTEFGF